VIGKLGGVVSSCLFYSLTPLVASQTGITERLWKTQACAATARWAWAWAKRTRSCVRGWRKTDAWRAVARGALLRSHAATPALRFSSRSAYFACNAVQRHRLCSSRAAVTTDAPDARRGYGGGGVSPHARRRTGLGVSARRAFSPYAGGLPSARH
jgi:hypothetical protein